MSRGVSLVFGPAPIEEAIHGLAAEAGNDPGIYRGLARLRMLQGNFAEARQLNAKARSGFEDLGNRHQAVSLQQAAGEIEYHAGDPVEGARLIREAYDGLTASGDRGFASTVAGVLGEVLLDLRRDGQSSFPVGPDR